MKKKWCLGFVCIVSWVTAAVGSDDAMAMGVDSDGIPLLCGTGLEARVMPFASNGETFQEWEVYPSVLRADSDESAFIRVRPNREVDILRLVLPTSDIVMPDDLNFHDDGLSGDRVAGDGEYSLGPFTLKEWQASITTVPTTLSIGVIQVVGTDGISSTFAIYASIGVLPVDYVQERVAVLREDVQLTRNLLNVQSGTFRSQEALRSIDPDRTRDYIKSLYTIVNDEYDMMVLLSSGKIESTNQRASSSQIAGVHYGCRNGPLSLTDFNQSFLYGSSGRLASINVLDYQDRGMISSNLMHEILHQWGAHFDNSLGFRNQTSHYDVNSNAGSLLGGHKWAKQADGGFLVNTSVGRASSSRASPCDLFSMGLLALEDLPELYLAEGIDYSLNVPVVSPDKIFHTITQEDIRSVYGDRLPDPAKGQRDFRILFVVESKDRLLNQDEMTYYSGFVKESMRLVDESDPDPVLSNNWAPITRFFGDGVTWDNRISVRANLFEAGVDHDGDGYSSALESLLGLDAFDRDSRPRFGLRREGVMANVVFEPYLPEVGVRLFESNDLVNWSAIESGLAVSGLEVRFPLNSKDRQFYRVKMELPPAVSAEEQSHDDIQFVLEDPGI